MNSKLHIPSFGGSNTHSIRSYLEVGTNPKLQPRNLSELSSLVKNRLTAKRQTNEKKSNNRQWLQNKGINIQPLFEFISDKTKKQIQPENISKQQLRGNLIIQPTFLDHQTFLNKCFNYAEINSLGHASTNRTIRKRFFKNTITKLNCHLLSSSSQPLSTLGPVYNRQIQKKEKYIKLVKQLIKTQKTPLLQNKKKIEIDQPLQSDKSAKLFYENIEHPIWNIIYKQVQDFDVNVRSKQNTLTNILINSLSLVQQQFADQLPLNSQSLNYYLHQNYLSKIQQKGGTYIFDSQHGSLWGKIFIYFRSGKIKQALNLLSLTKQMSLVSAIQENVQSINKKQPKKINIQPFLRKDVEDIFRQQILYAIGGEKRYSSEVLTNLSTLDCVWILLRNTGIYYETDCQMFREIRSQMIEFYQTHNLQKQSIIYAAYLLDYDSIVKSIPNCILDKDDLIHILIILSRYPVLVDNQELLLQRLTQLSIEYAVQLAQQSRSQFIYYMLMIREDRLVEQASSLIVSNKLYLSVPWVQLQAYIQSHFQQLLIKTSQKYVLSTHNYLEAAHQLVNLIGAKQKALNFLTLMLIDHFQKRNVYQIPEINQALHFYDSLIYENNQVNKQFCRLFELFDCLNILFKASVNRRYDCVQKILENKHLIFCQNIDYTLNRMLDKLMELKGLNIFFIFLSQLSLATTYYLNDSRMNSKLNQYKYLLYKTASTVFNHQKYKQFAYSESVQNLIGQLSYQALEQSSYKESVE